MANRVTADEVRAIMDDTSLADDLVNACITGANALITKVFEYDTELNTTLYKELERWIAAHMVASSPAARTAKKEGAGGASIEYTGKYEKNLEATPYGQMAISLDPTGRLSALGGKSAEMYAIPSFDE